MSRDRSELPPSGCILPNLIIDFFAERGVFLEPEAAEHLQRHADPTRHAERVLTAFLEVPFYLTLSQLLEAESLLPPEPQRALPLQFQPAAPPMVPLARAEPPVPSSNAKPLAAEYDAEIRILRDASHEIAPTGDVKDFVQYFNDRLANLTRLLRRRREVANAVPVARAKDTATEVQLIGMLTDVSKRAKSGHRFLELEDTSGECTLLVHPSRPDLVELADTLLKDEVIGVVAKPTKDGSLFVVDQILRPDLPLQTERMHAEAPLYAAFLGDVHLGSRTFLADQFRRMIRWLHGSEGSLRERSIASQIKYLVLPGDIVDGVGVFPGQEESLLIPEVHAQYRALAKELERIPKHVSLVVLPGNHDASRPSEPQPALGPEIQSYFHAIDARFVSNPSLFALHGVTTFAYHGFSMVDFATNVPNSSVDRPLEIMKQMLQCRHVAPLYGGKTPLSPEARDLLVIDPVPDVFVTGHVHVAAVGQYKGVTLVNGGTWQSQTSYQRMRNVTPTPALMPIVNLSNLSATMIDFSAA